MRVMNRHELDNFAVQSVLAARIRSFFVREQGEWMSARLNLEIAECCPAHGAVLGSGVDI